MAEPKALEALFPGRRRLILQAVYGESARWWSQLELAGRAGLHLSALRHHLCELRDAGLIRERRDNGRVLYQPDPACPVFTEMQSIIAKLTDFGGGGETILVVEDQPATAQITRILLESWGYSVVEAHGGAEAIQVFENHQGEIHLLLTDVIMPGMTGPQLAGELMRRKPDLSVIYMSGYPNQELPRENAGFLPKPFNPSGLAKAIRNHLDRRGVRR